MHEETNHLQFNKIVHLMQIGYYEDAIKMAQEYIRTNPHDADGYGILGKINLRQGRYQEALHWAQEALRSTLIPI